MNAIKTLGLMTAGAFVLACGIAQADETPRVYVGVGYSHMTLDGGTADYTLPITTFHAGVEIAPNLSVEGRYGINAGDDEQYDSGVLVTYGVKSYWAVVLKGRVPVTDAFSFYGMAGVNSLSVDFHGQSLGWPLYTLSGSAEETGSTLGAGGELRLGDSLTLSLEYQRVHEDVSGYNLGLNYRF